MITPEQAQQAADRLDQIEMELSAIGTWLTMGDEDRAGILIEDATRSIMAAARLVERRARRFPVGWSSRRPYSETGPQRGGMRQQ